MKRTSQVLLAGLMVVLAIVGSTVAGAGHADARWRETPRIGVMGDEVWSAGKNGCRGTMGVGLRNNPAKPGWVELRVRSRGFTKDNCKVTLRFTYNNTVAPFSHARYFNVQGAKKRGPLMLTKRLWIGSGVDLVAFTSTNPAQKGASFYIAIP